MRLTGHTHDRESPIQNFSTAPKKLGAHISSPVWPPKPTEFVSYLGNLRCDAFTALKSVQSARNESLLAGSDNFHRVRSAIEFEAWLVEQHTCEKVIGLIQEMMDSAARLFGQYKMMQKNWKEALAYRYSSESIQWELSNTWILTWQGLDGFQRSLYAETIWTLCFVHDVLSFSH